MNNITIAGNVTKDMETRFMPNGDAVGSFSVADNQWKDKPAIFWNCQLFGKRAESLAQYLTKGQSVTVTGSVTEREWTDKDGMKRKSMDVRVNDIALQGGRKDGSEQPATASRQSQTTKRPAPASFQDDADIPF